VTKVRQLGESAVPGPNGVWRAQAAQIQVLFEKLSQEATQGRDDDLSSRKRALFPQPPPGPPAGYAVHLAARSASTLTSKSSMVHRHKQGRVPR